MRRRDWMIPFLLLAATPACGHSAAAPAGNGGVAWVDHPAPSHQPPPPRPVPYAASAPACRPTQLRATDAGGGAAMGNVLQRFRFSNTGHATCLLRGFPTITGLTPSGQRVLLHLRRSPTDTFFGALVPAAIAPGQHVYLDLGGEDVTCDLTHPVVYRDLAFGVPGGGTLPSHARLRRLCRGWDTSRFGLPPRTTATIPPRPGSLDTLRVSLHAPSSAGAGITLEYLVTLSNATETPVRLTPCPSYTEAIYALSRHSVRSASFFLNCNTVHIIAPGQRVRFHMRLAMPALPRGPAKVGWHLDTPGETAGATMIAIRSPKRSGSTPATHVCDASQLRLAYGPDVTPKTGQNPRSVRLTNRARTCLLDGYPTIHLADAGGNLLPFAVADSGDQMITGASPIRVRLPSGGHAWIAVNKYHCDLGDRRQVSTLQLQVPGRPGTATLSFPATEDWGYCGANDPGSTIHVSPFEPTFARTLTDR